MVETIDGRKRNNTCAPAFIDSTVSTLSIAGALPCKLSLQNPMVTRSDHLLIRMACLLLFCDLPVHVFEIGMPTFHAMPRIHVYAVFILCTGINL